VSITIRQNWQFFPAESAKATVIKNISKSPKENLTKITDKGIEFRSIYDGSRHFLDAKKSMAIQSNLGTGYYYGI